MKGRGGNPLEIVINMQISENTLGKKPWIPLSTPIKELDIITTAN